MPTIRAVIEELEASKIVRPQRPATMRDVSRAQALLGVSLPRRYIELVRHCGVLNVYDGCVFGLGPYCARRDRETASTVFQTLDRRRTYDLPPYLVVIWDDCHEDCQCLDLRKVRGGDCAVVVHDPGAKGARRVRPAAPNLDAWLRLIVEKQLEKKKVLDREMPGRLTAMGGFRKRRKKVKGRK